MVLLQRLVLQGFKSFKRKTSVPFPSGFTVITGPNGSGKTNIGDAIAFVLGKSSSRSLRAKRGEDLIFHGSKSKGASDFAAVVLYFDNAKKTLPVPDGEVSVGRRVNRKGVSTYRLNGRVVTRQEVVDLLSQGGIHPDGHNIIQQGDVTHIVEMDPVQRRGIVDEISGIKEYDEKRVKALKELEKVGEKVREAEILLTEKSTVLEKLRTDRDAALEHKKLGEMLDRVRTSLILKDFSSAQEQFDQISKETGKKEKEFKEREGHIQRLDKELEKEEKTLQSLTKEVIQASSQIEISKKIAHLQSGIEGKKEQVASLQREMERLDELIERVSRIESKINPSIREVLSLPGVRGVLLDLIAVPKEYRIAVEVAGGGHLQDVVADSLDTAVRCVNFLKSKKLGRARFLPLDKIQPSRKGLLPPACIGWLSDLIHFDKKYSPAMEYVFGSTACVKDIETAKEIMKRQRMRMVTLDGDLLESSGAVMGGYYRRGEGADVKSYLRERGSLVKRMEGLEEEIKVLSKELSSLADKEKGTRTFDIEKERQGLDKRLENIREERKEAYEQRLTFQQEIGRLNIQKAKIEARLDNLKLQLPGKKETPLDRSVAELRAMEKGGLDRLQQIGPVNMKAIEEFDAIVGEFEEFKEKVEKIMDEKKAIEESLQKIEERRKETFMKTLGSVTKHFQDVYKELTGGEAELVLEDQSLDSGLLVKATPPGKKLLHIDAMSGGEKTLTAFAFLFALQKHKPAPFYILDEADAALDRINTERVVSLLRKQSKGAQFIVISHNDGLVREADQIFGVTMDGGESKVMGIEVPES